MSPPADTNHTDADATPPTLRERLISGAREAAIGLILGALVFVVVSAYQSRALIATGAPAPAIEAVGLDGQPLRIEPADASGQKKTLLYFWAPWCGVCEVAADNVAALAEDDEDVRVLGVALAWRTPEEVANAASEHGASFPIALAPREVSRQDRIEVFPTIYVLDEEGRVEHRATGYTSSFGLWWRLTF